MRAQGYHQASSLEYFIKHVFVFHCRFLCSDEDEGFSTEPVENNLADKPLMFEYCQKVTNGWDVAKMICINVKFSKPLAQWINKGFEIIVVMIVIKPAQQCLTRKDLLTHVLSCLFAFESLWMTKWLDS